MKSVLRDVLGHSTLYGDRVDRSRSHDLPFLQSRRKQTPSIQLDVCHLFILDVNHLDLSCRQRARQLASGLFLPPLLSPPSLLTNSLTNFDAPQQTFGIIFDIPQALLGITVLAWGNSVSDAIADVVVAKQGFPQMAIAACYGGPLFSLISPLSLRARMRSDLSLLPSFLFSALQTS